MSFLPMKSLLDKSLKKSGIKKQVTTARTLEIAGEALVFYCGEGIKGFVQPAYIQYKTLYIASLSPAAAIEVGHHADAIVEYINTALGSKTIQKMTVIT